MLHLPRLYVVAEVAQGSPRGLSCLRAVGSSEVHGQRTSGAVCSPAGRATDIRPGHVRWVYSSPTGPPVYQMPAYWERTAAFLLAVRNG